MAQTPDADPDRIGAIRRRAVTKATWRLIPLLILGYLFNYIDRTNVGFASLTMNADLALSATQFGLAAGMFYVGYCLVEVPSNLALHRFGARRWLARIMVSWGLAAALTALAVGPRSYYLIRFVTGVAEAGFFPGVIFYLTMWFPAAIRARILAWFMVAIPLSSVVSGPVSTAILQMDGLGGLHGWQWLFILEGLPACLLGLVTLAVLADSPRTARWLTDEEREVLVAALEAEARGRPQMSLTAAIRDPRVLLLSAIYFCFLVGVLGIGIWLPQILKEHGLTTLQIGLVSAAPYFAACVAMLVWAGVVDRSRRYLVHYIVACLVAAVGFAVSVAFDALAPALAGVTVAVVGLNSARAPFFAIPSQFLGGAAAAGGIALINSAGNFGGFVGPYMVGWLRDATGSFSAGMYVLAGLLVLSAVLALVLHRLAPVQEARAGAG